MWSSILLVTHCHTTNTNLPEQCSDNLLEQCGAVIQTPYKKQNTSNTSEASQRKLSSIDDVSGEVASHVTDPSTPYNKDIELVNIIILNEQPVTECLANENDQLVTSMPQLSAVKPNIIPLNLSDAVYCTEATEKTNSFVFYSLRRSSPKHLPSSTLVQNSTCIQNPLLEIAENDMEAVQSEWENASKRMDPIAISPIVCVAEVHSV